MVRFHWHGRDSCVAFVPLQGLQSCIGPVQHIDIEMEIPGVAGSSPAILSIRKEAANGVPTLEMRKVGVVIAHDADPSSWKGELLSALAQVHHQPTMERKPSKSSNACHVSCYFCVCIPCYLHACM
jgi:hypothetical protein